MGLSQDNKLKSAVRCGHIKRFILKITEVCGFFFSKYLECLEYFLWQNGVSVGMLSVL